MQYELAGNVLKEEKEIERLLNLPLVKFEEELTNYTKNKLVKITYQTFEMIGRIKGITPFTTKKDKLTRIIKLRLD